jgi:glycosyltransferase involved in cell wall biosynthesis
MKVLFIAHCNDLSGANKSFLSLIEILKEKIEIVVMCNQYPGAFTDKVESLGVPVIEANYAWWYIKPRKNPAKQIYRKIKDTKAYKKNWLTADLLLKLREEKFDIVYTNTSTIDAGAKIAEALMIPHIWHVREFGKEDFEFIPILSQVIYQQTFLKSEKIIVISDALKNKLLTMVPEEKLVRIYNGLEIEKMQGVRRKEHGDTVNVLVTGQVCSGKGQRQAILAVNILRNAGFDVDLYIAGDIDYSYLNPILKEMGGEKKWLHILGICKDMYSLRNRMDIELVCSRSEAFGRVTLEAMLHEVAVIGSNAGGTPELIENENTGLLYEYGDIEGLSRCIVKLTENDKLRQKIVNNAKFFAEGFTIQRTAEDVYAVFKEVEQKD